MNQHHPENTVTLELSVNEIEVLGHFFQTYKDMIKSEANEWERWLRNPIGNAPERTNAAWNLAQTDLMDEFKNLWLYHDTKEPF